MWVLGCWWLFRPVMLWNTAHFLALALFACGGLPLGGHSDVCLVNQKVPRHTNSGRSAIRPGPRPRDSGIGVLALPHWCDLLLRLLLACQIQFRLLQMSSLLGPAPGRHHGRQRFVFAWSILYLFGICLLLADGPRRGPPPFFNPGSQRVQPKQSWELAGGCLPVFPCLLQRSERQGWHSPWQCCSLSRLNEAHRPGQGSVTKRGEEATVI